MASTERSAGAHDAGEHGPGERGALGRALGSAAGTLLGAAPGGLGGTARLGVACARFNDEVTGRLLAGARAAWRSAGIKDGDVVVVEVPGAFELPLAAAVLARSGRVDTIACLGAVIRGETSHYDLVAGECAAGCQRVQLDTGVPVAFGVVTTEDLAQALARAGGERGDKGAEAVETALEMLGVLRALPPVAG